MNILGWLGHNELILFKLKRYSSSTDKTARGEAQNDTQITTRAWLDIIYYMHHAWTLKEAATTSHTASQKCTRSDVISQTCFALTKEDPDKTVCRTSVHASN